MAFNPDEYLKEKGAFDPDEYLKEFSSEPQQPAQEKKPPAWYDVPGKVSKTLSETGKKIEREGELTGTGKQSGLAGGLWSLAHAGSGLVRGVGDVLSPIVENPLSKELIKGAAVSGGFRSSNAERGVTPTSENTRITALDTAVESGKEYLKNNPEVANRIGSGIDIVSLAAPEFKAGSAIGKGTQKVTGEALESFGKNAPNRILKPKERDFNAGFKPENVYKYEVDGTLDQTIKKTQDKIENLAADLKARIQAGDDAGARVNAFEHIDKTIEKMKGEGVKNLNKNAAIKHLQSLKEEIAISNPDGILDLADAQDFKRAVGSEGAWYESKWGKMIDKDANAKEKAFSNLYTEIKNDIELKAPEGIKEINQQLSELIPIENTALKRLYVAKRNEPISLKDMIGIATVATTGLKGAPVYLLNKAANSQLTGRVAYNMGMALQGKKNIPGEIPAFEPKPKIDADIETPTNYETPTYLRKGRAPLPEQPLETEWKKPLYQETPTSAKMMQFVEDFNKKKQPSQPIEGIDYMNRDAAGDLTQQITEKKKLPVTLPMKESLIPESLKKDFGKSAESLTKKESDDIFKTGSGFVKSVKGDINIQAFSKWLDNLTPEERDNFIKRLRGTSLTQKQEKILSSSELADKLIPSSVMTQQDLSKLRW